jgi:homoserine kinase
MPGLSAGQKFNIAVPASIANLGPGFDVLAVAVQLYLRLDVTVVEGFNRLQFNFIGCQLRGENYIERAFRFLLRQNPTQFPSMRIDVRADIPMSSGLGSSAAATVAGLRLYALVVQALPMQAMLNAATTLEGHPDNAAAALLGGLAVSCALPDGSVYAGTYPWPEEVEFIVVTPSVPLPTKAARKVVPHTFSRTDVVFNLQRVALLFQSLQSRNYQLLRQALADKLHQPYRKALVPGLEDVLHLEHEDLLGACLSGAGPSVAVLCCKNQDAIVELLKQIYTPLNVGFVIRRLKVHSLQEQSGLETGQALPVLPS